jgi:sulfonate transport system ATP-binding protein
MLDTLEISVDCARREAPQGPTSAPRASGGVEVVIRQLSKTYGARDVLKNTQLTIQAGEFVAIVGRSGCGKSTLLRLVAGLESPSHGAVELNGQSVDGLHPDTRIMFQDARLLPWRSVQANVALGLPESAAAAAHKVLQQVGLGDRGGEWPARLSGGQRQRVSLARALVHHPRLLLLDEPLGALDALTRIEMHQLIEDLWLHSGFTALLVTHDVQEAVALADRVILIEDGRIALDQHIDIPRPRQPGDLRFAALERQILQRVLQRPGVESPERADHATRWPGAQAHGLRWAV